MVRAIEGTYCDGRVELNEPGPAGPASRVLVVFLPDDHEREAAIARVIERMKTGFPIGAPYPTREELHERR